MKEIIIAGVIAVVAGSIYSIHRIRKTKADVKQKLAEEDEELSRRAMKAGDMINDISIRLMRLDEVSDKIKLQLEVATDSLTSIRTQYSTYTAVKNTSLFNSIMAQLNGLDSYVKMIEASV